MSEQRERVIGFFRDEGIELARIATAEVLDDARSAALEASESGRLADMAWMTSDWLGRATDPGTFLAGARSIIICALPNHSVDPERPQSDSVSRGRVARYARGRDYHRTFETKLRRVARRIRDEEGGQARATVDYGPLLERPFAAAAGLGWSGKSTMLLAPGFGPWVMLGAVATDLPLQPDPPLAKSCGSCTRCVVACPTGAIAPDGGVLDSRLCISYHTIENRGSIPRELRARFGDWVFGCDACLDSCPVGASTFISHPDFVPGRLDDAFPGLQELLALSEEEFRTRFQGRAVRRAGRDGMARNACVALGNVGSVRDLPALTEALRDVSALVRAHAAWAVGEIARRSSDHSARLTLEDRLAIEHDAEVREEIEAACAAIERGVP